MKRLLVVLGVLVSITTFGQKQLGKLTYEQCQTSSVFRRIKNNTKIFKYIVANGAVLEIGDTLIIGKPSGSETITFEEVDEDETSALVAISKTRKSFLHIILGNYPNGGNVRDAFNCRNYSCASVEMQGQVVVVTDMKVFHKGSRNSSLRLFVLLEDPKCRAFGITKYMSIKDYEKAVLAGEIRALHAPLTRKQAIAKLKEAKELFDLWVIDKSDYEKLKTEMAKIIKGNKM